MEASSRALMVKSSVMEGFKTDRQTVLMLRHFHESVKNESLGFQSEIFQKKQKISQSQFFSHQIRNSPSKLSSKSIQSVFDRIRKPDPIKICQNNFSVPFLNLQSKLPKQQQTDQPGSSQKQRPKGVALGQSSDKLFDHLKGNKIKQQALKKTQKIVPISSSNSNVKSTQNIRGKMRSQEKILLKSSLTSLKPSSYQIQVGQRKNKINEKYWKMQDFDKIKILGTGKYGKVYLASERKTNFLCAIKVIEKRKLKQEGIIDQFIRELKIQSYFNHQNLIKTYGYFCDKTSIYIIMEPATGGQLYSQPLVPISQRKASEFIRQICEGLEEMHSKQIVHRDLKPQNIVVHEGMVKICDFGLSVFVGNNLRSTFCGTPLYVSPEILKGNKYDEKVDVWALGIMLFEMLFGEDPFKISKEHELIKIVENELTLPDKIKLSKDAHNFLLQCLKKNPHGRMDVEELLLHPFIRPMQNTL